jgi:hypothetical protein
VLLRIEQAWIVLKVGRIRKTMNPKIRKKTGCDLISSHPKACSSQWPLMSLMVTAYRLRTSWSTRNRE